MKYIKIALNIISTVLVFVTNVSFAFALELKSTNYKIVEAETNSAGEVQKSTNYNLLTTISTFTGDPRAYSTNYRSGFGVEVFTANTPQISCFETDSDGSSNCTTGPTYLNSYGVVRVCGRPGCYNRARFEIDTENNPADTLYGIQISTDSFVSDVKYVDGVTKKPIDADDRTIDDYLTKADWETNTLNISGLQSSTQYSIRAVALHGDFTESDAGPIATTSTTAADMQFDIDIDDIDGQATESADPYTISFVDSRRLIQTGPAQSASNLIWLDIQTNALGGFALVQKGKNGGLNSSSQSYTIESATIDLDTVTEGFGLSSYYTNQAYDTDSGDGDLGEITAVPTYTGSGNYVGIVDTVYQMIYGATKPIASGRCAIMAKARASATSPEATDYTEEITLILVPRY